MTVNLALALDLLDLVQLAGLVRDRGEVLVVVSRRLGVGLGEDGVAARLAVLVRGRVSVLLDVLGDLAAGRLVGAGRRAGRRRRARREARVVLAARGRVGELGAVAGRRVGRGLLDVGRRASVERRTAALVSSGRLLVVAVREDLREEEEVGEQVSLGVPAEDGVAQGKRSRTCLILSIVDESVRWGKGSVWW